MSEYKEFTAKNVDDAIADACRHFDVNRGKLEIEILSGGSTGIFGLVGIKKAVVRARLRSQPGKAIADTGKSGQKAPKNNRVQEEAPQQAESDATEQTESNRSGQAQGDETRRPDHRAQQAPQDAPRGSHAGDAASHEQETSDKGPSKTNRRGRKPTRPKKAAVERNEEERQETGAQSKPAGAAGETDAEAASESSKPKRSRSRRGGRGRGRRGGSKANADQNGAAATAKENGPSQESRTNRGPKQSEESLPGDVDLPENGGPVLDDDFGEDLDEAHALPENFDAEKAVALAEEATADLLKNIIGETPKLSVTVEDGRVKALIDDEENSGLIIGRNGETISALQYMVNRIVARKADFPIRVYLDAGDYREKQNDNLRRMAIYLADKAKTQRRTQSTRPLSSYHRRVVHMALQDEATIQTRSAGDGPMKRVLIFHRPERSDRQDQ